MWRRLMVIMVPDVSNVRIKDDNAAVDHARCWESDRFRHLCHMQWFRFN
jgi:hypothetical protein